MQSVLLATLLICEFKFSIFILTFSLSKVVPNPVTIIYNNI